MDIDFKATGTNLKYRIKLSGYDVKYVKNYLGDISLQSIYKWQWGESLPTVEHLYKLSQLLGVSMEELLVLKSPYTVGMDRRIEAYSKYQLSQLN